jgi:hypothetical protein
MYARRSSSVKPQNHNILWYPAIPQPPHVGDVGCTVDIARSVVQCPPTVCGRAVDAVWTSPAAAPGRSLNALAAACLLGSSERACYFTTLSVPVLTLCRGLRAGPRRSVPLPAVGPLPGVLRCSPRLGRSPRSARSPAYCAAPRGCAAPGGCAAARGRRHARCGLRHALCGLRHALCGLRHALCGLRHALCGLRHALCGLRHALCGLRHALCGLRHALCGLRHALCGLRHALCGLRHGTCIRCSPKLPLRARAPAAVATFAGRAASR